MPSKNAGFQQKKPAAPQAFSFLFDPHVQLTCNTGKILDQ